MAYGVAPGSLPGAEPGAATAQAGTGYDLFGRSNVVAWCIVPFDGTKRGPEERAAMLEKLGIKSFAYDYRAEHIPTFDAEMDALQRHHIRLLAWWFPTQLNDEARLILEVLKRHELRGVQLWVMGGGEAVHSEAEQKARVEAEAARLRPIAEEAAKLGSTVGLYNHGGWFGEPENQLAILERLRSEGFTNIGIVYNLHHGHAHLDRFPKLLTRMKPYLLVVNLNGMGREGEKKLILPLGQGEYDARLLQEILDSGWRGPVGILNHTDEDAETRLRLNLEGLERLREGLKTHAASDAREAAAVSGDSRGQTGGTDPRQRLSQEKDIPELGEIAWGQRRDALLGASANQPRERDQSSGGLDVSFARFGDCFGMQSHHCA
jgi:sugar phosphate isomerase/epimerase